MLRSLHLAQFPTHKDLLRHMHGQLAARLDEIEALTPTSAPYGCVLVAKPGAGQCANQIPLRLLVDGLCATRFESLCRRESVHGMPNHRVDLHAIAATH